MANGRGKNPNQRMVKLKNWPFSLKLAVRLFWPLVSPVRTAKADILASFLDYFLKSVILERDQLDGWYHCNREVVDLTRVFPLSIFFSSCQFKSAHLKTI